MGRPKEKSEADLKRAKAERARMQRCRQVNIRENISQWNEIKLEYGFQHDGEVAKFLIDSYKESEKPRKKRRITSTPLTGHIDLPGLSALKKSAQKKKLGRNMILLMRHTENKELPTEEPDEVEVEEDLNLEASQEKGNDAIKPWIGPIINHFFYSAETCCGDDMLLKTRLVSVLNHVSNRHEWGHGGCNHGPLTDGEKQKETTSELESFNNHILISARKYSKSANCWSVQPLKVAKDYTHIPGLMKNIINLFCMGEAPMLHPAAVKDSHPS
ncbi:hypothetical protein MAR_012461 [Mya arenaria]|uniref:Uncharacterized protein n=1 Tax=Mya arenaria TaxID=6604 RepID=A0ABY7G0C5_MYAAR|nr:hypothetical protein MAR_012461 [Mya arenaria]